MPSAYSPCAWRMRPSSPRASIAFTCRCARAHSPSSQTGQRTYPAPSGLEVADDLRCLCPSSQCARSWNETQRRHPAADEGPQYRCPMCRQTYTQLIYDCVDRTFQTEALDSTAQAPAGGLPRLQLTAAQRRRRSRYAGPAGQSQVDNGANADSAHRSALAGPSAGPARQQRSALR